MLGLISLPQTAPDPAIRAVGGNYLLLPDRRRGPIPQTTVRPRLIIFLPPGLDPDTCFGTVEEPSGVQAFVAQLPVKRLVGPIAARASPARYRSS